MNWGIKVTLLYVGFVAMILVMVSMTMHQPVDLESTDYYDQELKFQEKIDMVNRTNALPEQLSWKIGAQKIDVQFPSNFRKNKIEGTIKLFRPSDSNMDKQFAIKADTLGMQSISTKSLKGMYKLKITWKTSGQDYYNEGVINLK